MMSCPVEILLFFLLETRHFISKCAVRRDIQHLSHFREALSVMLSLSVQSFFDSDVRFK